jgi:hypothetical protein
MTEPKQVPGRGSPPATPRWVKIFVIIFIILVLLVTALHVMGFNFGHHGMGGAEISASIAARQL